MGTPLFISFVVPVYNRPQEVEELLESLVVQSEKNFEIIIVEDGSSLPCDGVIKPYQQQLSITYKAIPNGGPSNARNVGVQSAKGAYLIFLDSDVVLPRHYMAIVNRALLNNPSIDLFGGPDTAHEDFTPIQKAINYSMTSVITTGGIRGKKVHAGRYCPRTFNMGCRTTLFEQLRGFDVTMRFGEDIDFCLRAYGANAKVYLLEEAWVYHKRRVDFKKFYKQVFNSGIARIHLEKRHPHSMELVHTLPAMATTLFVLLVVFSCFYPILLVVLALFACIVFTDALHSTKNLKVALLSLVATFIQITGYGSGFLVALWRCYILRGKEFSAFEKTFYN